MRLQESYGHGSNQNRQALPQCWQMPIYDTNQHGNLHSVILLMQNKHTDKDTSQMSKCTRASYSCRWKILQVPEIGKDIFFGLCLFVWFFFNTFFSPFPLFAVKNFKTSPLLFLQFDLAESFSLRAAF